LYRINTKEPEKIFNSPDFTSISERPLISLIKNDNLQMSDIKIWKHVFKWGIAQNPGLSSDPSSYSNDEFATLKNTLQQCILFIKFVRFTSKEFLNKVYSYKMIMPEKLYENLINWLLDNDYNPSDKLEPQMVKEISCKMNNNDYNPNGKLELRYEINNDHNPNSKL
jgi:hypothetical protein